MFHPDNAVVVRLVYDGPPRSGKTTSLRALAGNLSRPHLSWDEAADGRTLYFDWVEYIGGSFDGMPIRCQILSVPGQRALARRRKALLALADAVILVADTTEAGVAEAVETLGSLRTFLESRPGPPPGVIVQANKRDQPDALPLDAIRAHLGGDGLAVIESVATAGTGIREAFVFAVRLALDRIRERLASGNPQGAPDPAETPEQLLARLKAEDPVQPPAAAFLREVLAGEDSLRSAPPASTAVPRGSGEPASTASTRPPRLPDSQVPTGRVWPPVTGRMLLHEALAESAEPSQGADGSWRLHLGHWYLHSAREHCFSDLESGREALLAWARLHSGTLGRLAPRRCIVLAETGDGGWRLWQLVHHEPSLRQELQAALAGGDPEALAESLLACAADLLAARKVLVEEPPLPCRLELLGRIRSSVFYVGLLPPPAWAPPAGELETDARALLLRELLPHLEKDLASSQIDVPRVLAALGRAGSRSGQPPWDLDLPETLSGLLTGRRPRP